MKVTPERIKALMARVTVTIVKHTEPTTHLVAIAWLDGAFHIFIKVSRINCFIHIDC